MNWFLIAFIWWLIGFVTAILDWRWDGLDISIGDLVAMAVVGIIGPFMTLLLICNRIADSDRLKRVVIKGRKQPWQR